MASIPCILCKSSKPLPLHYPLTATGLTCGLFGWEIVSTPETESPTWLEIDGSSGKIMMMKLSGIEEWQMNVWNSVILFSTKQRIKGAVVFLVPLEFKIAPYRIVPPLIALPKWEVAVIGSKSSVFHWLSSPFCFNNLQNIQESSRTDATLGHGPAEVHNQASQKAHLMQGIKGFSFHVIRILVWSLKFKFE